MNVKIVTEADRGGRFMLCFGPVFYVNMPAYPPHVRVCVCVRSFVYKTHSSDRYLDLSPISGDIACTDKPTRDTKANILPFHSHDIRG